MRFTKTEFGYLVRLEPGEEILSALSRLVNARTIGSGSISGIGAASDITLGYFDRARKEYVKKPLAGEYEILSLTGNISHFGKDPWIHVHAIVSGPDFAAVGGHLFSGTVTVTAELVLTVGQETVVRIEDVASGFRHLELKDSL